MMLFIKKKLVKALLAIFVVALIIGWLGSDTVSQAIYIARVIIYDASKNICTMPINYLIIKQ